MDGWLGSYGASLAVSVDAALLQSKQALEVDGMGI